MKLMIVGSRIARLACLLAAVLVVVEVSRGGVEDGHQIEKEVMAYTASDAFRALRTDRRCHDQNAYHVYLIDNFEQGIRLVPEVMTSHGEMLLRLLRTGRDDIEVHVLNTSLSKGLAEVIQVLVGGSCVDAVVSSVPGSNYTYAQVSSLLPGRVPLTPENILSHREALRRLLRHIARYGFPSVEWLRNIDVNSTKLRNDARKLVFIEALGRFSVPVILPYGNADVRYKGRIRAVNLLGLAPNARLYSALDRSGKRLEGFPYSPLSSGDAPSEYKIVECPHPDDPFKAVLDINEDYRWDYTFYRVGRIPYRNKRGRLAFAPPVTRQDVFRKWLSQVARVPKALFTRDIVLTAQQYRQLGNLFSEFITEEPTQSYVWLNAPHCGTVFSFDPVCRVRGTVSGTSVIPPHKVKDLLPPKAVGTSKDPARSAATAGG